MKKVHIKAIVNLIIVLSRTRPFGLNPSRNIKKPILHAHGFISVHNLAPDSIVEAAPASRPARGWEGGQISSFRVASSLSWFWLRPECDENMRISNMVQTCGVSVPYIHSYNLALSSPRPTHPFDAHHSVHPTSFYRYWMREARGTTSTIKCRAARSHVPDWAAKFGAAVGRPIPICCLPAVK